MKLLTSIVLALSMKFVLIPCPSSFAFEFKIPSITVSKLVRKSPIVFKTSIFSCPDLLFGLKFSKLSMTAL